VIDSLRIEIIGKPNDEISQGCEKNRKALLESNKAKRVALWLFMSNQPSSSRPSLMAEAATIFSLLHFPVKPVCLQTTSNVSVNANLDKPEPE